MKLITEQNENIEFVTETLENGKKNHYIEGIFIQTEQKNRNGRLYEKKMMVPVLEKYMEESVKSNRAFGELNHPTGPSINLDRVCILIKELKWNNNDVHGKALITDTPMGNIVKGLLESGAQLGVSTRGMGELEKRSDGVMIVRPGYHLATAADVVADPSAPNAFVRGIMEGTEWIYDASRETWFEEKIEETKNKIKKMNIRELEEKKLLVFENFIKSLTSKNV
jgi:hypothetical protein